MTELDNNNYIFTNFIFSFMITNSWNNRKLYAVVSFWTDDDMISQLYLDLDGFNISYQNSMNEIIN